VRLGVLAERLVSLGDLVVGDATALPERVSKIPPTPASPSIRGRDGGPQPVSSPYSFAVLARDTEPVHVADGVVRLGTDLVNWYLVEDGGKVTIVDAGAPKYRPQLERGLAFLGRSTGDVEALILTHGHADHIGFAEPVRAELSIPVYVHSDDAKLTTTGKAFGKKEASMLPYLRYRHAWKLLGHLGTSGMPKPVQSVTTFQDGDVLDVPGRPRVLHTPGHTTGHVVFALEDRKLLIMGDLLCELNPLTGERGPQLLPRAFNVSSATMLDSLSTIEGVDAETLVFGHGDPWRGGTAEAVRLARARGTT
jgi:glyoxylase-like metal-dependent hydrolase (beta-lactamase superfamily II)